MPCRLLLAVCLVLTLICPVRWCLSDDTKADNPKAEAKSAEEAGKEAGNKSKEKFVRLRRNDKNQPIAMETAVVRFALADGSQPDLVVDLVGAIHVGDKRYYEELNKLFESYEVVLYELVAPEGTRVPKEGRQGGGAHPIGMLQDGMKMMLELEHQLDNIDYTKENFVHADMSPEEFSKTMTNRGESFMQMYFRMMGQGMAQQAKSGNSGSGDAAILMALFSRDRAHKLKLAMAEQFENMEGQLDVLSGPEGSTIITERNKKAFEVLDKQLTAGKKKIAVFYGAGHFQDMQERLVKDFAMKRTKENWLTAWALEKPAKTEKQPEAEKAPVESKDQK